MTDPTDLPDETLDWLESILLATDPPPWVAMIEGHDHESGDSFIMVGVEGDRREDIYVSRESGPASAPDLEAIAVARAYMPELIKEVRQLRASISECDRSSSEDYEEE